MISIQKVIFPGIAAGCLFLVFVTSMIAKPTIALAAGSAAGGAEAKVAEERARAAAVAVAAGKHTVNKSLPAQSATAATSKASSGDENASSQDQPPAQAGEQQNGTKEAPCSLSLSYPDSIRQWCGQIERYAIENGLEPNLLAAVMLQESGGNPQAYSKSGAVGLLQVMPKDGLASGFMCINGPCFSSRPSMEELYDPDFNISYGARLLAGLIQKNGNVREALRLYGPMNMGYRYADIILNIMNQNR
jgi:soluble lytic murein transglycosylase-like protein